MKTIYVQDQHIEIANSWDDISLKDWIEIAKLQAAKEQKEDFSEMQFVIDLLDILTKADCSEMTVQEASDILNESTLFLQSLPDYDVKENFEFNGSWYVAKVNLDSLTLREKLMIDNLQKNTENTFDIIHYILAVLIRPGEYDYKNEKWKQHKLEKDINDIAGRADIILNMPIMYVIEMLNFFLTGKAK